MRGGIAMIFSTRLTRLEVQPHSRQLPRKAESPITNFSVVNKCWVSAIRARVGEFVRLTEQGVYLLVSFRSGTVEGEGCGRQAD